MRAFVLAFALALPAALFGASRSGATTVPELDDAALIAQSDVVGELVIRSHVSAWVGRRILTFYEADVVDTWRSPASGAAPAHVVIALPGGVVDGIGQKVFGTPALVDGAHYVACLGKITAPRDGRMIIGLWRGLWSVDDAGRALPFVHDDVVAAPALSRTALRARLAAPGAR
ncbi:MAG TPA: hypothetical protein VGO62_01870 [Myxococcota bacterium]|jgi:hypothetical protein